MPSLKELRKLLRVPQEDRPEVRKQEADRSVPLNDDPIVTPGKLYKLPNGKTSYVVDMEGRDAAIYFGKHRRSKVSGIAVKEPDYLSWLIRLFKSPPQPGQDFDGVVKYLDDDLIDIIRYQLRLNDRR
jgi:hypothetical protein